MYCVLIQFRLAGNAQTSALHSRDSKHALHVDYITQESGQARPVTSRVSRKSWQCGSAEAEQVDGLFGSTKQQQIKVYVCLAWVRERPLCSGMEAVSRMPMIWLELKEAGEFHFSSGVVQVSCDTVLSY